MTAAEERLVEAQSPRSRWAELGAGDDELAALEAQMASSPMSDEELEAELAAMGALETDDELDELAALEAQMAQ